MPLPSPIPWLDVVKILALFSLSKWFAFLSEGGELRKSYLIDCRSDHQWAILGHSGANMTGIDDG